MEQESEVVIRTTKLSKLYKIYSRPSDLLLELLLRRPRHKPFWPLRDIDLEVRKGQTVGLIGVNGAGKSTLLKILAGTLPRTSGTVEVKGRIAAILELGTGFHPEYSGRENIYLGGMCLGMTKEEIAQRLESIIDFSELRGVIDQPFKTYSSGMQARLTFSTAISVNPDVLIIDEALAVGDALFVGKCNRRIRQIVNSGATVLFVSHSTDTVRLFCDHAVWLSRGQIVLQGDVNTVTKAYDRFVYEQSDSGLREYSVAATELADNPTAGRQIDDNFFKYGTNEVRITSVQFVDHQDQPTTLVQSGDHVEMHIAYEGKPKNPEEQCHASVQIFSAQGLLVASAGTRRQPDALATGERGVFKLILEPLLLGTGFYFFSPFLATYDAAGKMRWLDFHDRAYCLQVKGRQDPLAPQMIEHPSRWEHAPSPEAASRAAAA